MISIEIRNIVSKRHCQDKLEFLSLDVHQILHTRRKLKGVDTIGNCCKCCCMWFESFHVLRHDKSMDASNFILSANPETCKACGLCVKRCPMEALSLQESPQTKNKKGKVSVLQADRCIGCGVCVYKCPSRSLTLVHRGKVTAPPAGPEGLRKSIPHGMVTPHRRRRIERIGNLTMQDFYHHNQVLQWFAG